MVLIKTRCPAIGIKKKNQADILFLGGGIWMGVGMEQSVSGCVAGLHIAGCWGGASVWPRAIATQAGLQPNVSPRSAAIVVD